MILIYQVLRKQNLTEHEKKIGGMNMRKVALSLMLAASMAATTLGSTAVFASDATTTESESYTYRYALADFPTNWSLHDNQTHTDSELMQYLEAGFYSFDYNDT
jgi:hypothetical protein